MRLFAACVVSCLCLSPVWAEGETWTVDVAGLELPIPAGWTLGSNQRGQPLLRRVDAAGAGFSESIGVSAGEAKVETLEALEAHVREQVEAGEVEFVARADLTLGATPAVRLDYRGVLRGVTLRWRMVAFLNHGKQVLVTCTVLDDRWESTHEALVAALSKATVREPKPPATLHPTAGVSLVPPDGWRPLPPHASGMWLLARWGLPTEDAQRMQGVLDLRGEPAPPGTTVDQVVEGLPQQTGMQLMPGDFEVDGEPARVLRNNAAQGQAPRRMVVSVHDGVVYSLILIGPQSAVADWQRAMGSLKWHERGEPSRFVGVPGAPIPLSRHVGVVPPGLLRLIGQGQGEVRLGVHDYRRGQGGIMLQVRSIGLEDPQVPTDAVCQQMSQQIGQQLGGVELEWQRVQGKLEALLSVPVAGQGEQRLMFAILRAAPNAVLLINYVIFDDRPEAVQAYRQAMGAMLGTAFNPDQGQQPGPGAQPGSGAQPDQGGQPGGGR